MPAAVSGSERLRVTTLNVLHDGVRSAIAPWTERRPRVVGLIRSLQPDVLCLQEVSVRQLEDLTLALPDYACVGGVLSGPIVLPALPMVVAKPMHWWRGDYFAAGEHCPILLRRETARAVAHGTIPLPAPALKTQQINWARVTTRSGFTFEVGNTHLGIQPWRAERSGRELLEAMNSLRNGYTQILTGDFNSTPGGGVLRELADGGGEGAFHDAWPDAEMRLGSGGTFHWGFGMPGPRIDYVLSRPRLTVRRAKVSGPQGGRPWPSDHWAVTVDYEVSGGR